MQRAEWLELSHSQGCGVDADLAWGNARHFQAISPKVELVYGGDEMELRVFESDADYTKMLDGVQGDALLNSLAHLPSVAKWVREKVWVGDRKGVVNGTVGI